MSRQLIYLLVFLALGSSTNAQLLPLLDQYQEIGMAINPAYTGSKGALSMELLSRRQWVGFEGAPFTSTLSVHSPMRNKKVNLGILLISDKIGSYMETGFLLNYAYRIDLGKGNLSLGLAAGITSHSKDMNAIRTTDLADPVYDMLSGRAFLPDFSIGSYYQTDRLFIGLSMPLFLTHSFDESNGKYGLGFQPGASNYILTGGYLLRLSEDFKLLPSLLLRTAPANHTQFDLNCKVIYKEKILVGSGIRTNGNLASLFQLQVNPQLRIGYTYGYEISELSNYQQGTHEVILIYHFNYLLEVLGPRYY